MSHLFVVSRKPGKYDVNTRGDTGDFLQGPSVDLSWRQLMELLGMIGINTAWLPMSHHEISARPDLFGAYTPNLIMAFKSAP